MNSTILISIIIPTYNCKHKLLRALQSIEEIDFPFGNFEVIIVDDGSNDDTRGHVNNHIISFKSNVVYLYQENMGPAAARNNGIRHAKGKYIFIIDSDCIVDRDILNQYLKHFPDNKLGGIGGNILPDSKNIITSYLDQKQVWLPGINGHSIIYLVTANAFFLKEAIEKSGYFDEDFRWPGGEEPELCYRIIKKGYYFKYDENATVIHAHRTTVTGMVKMFFSHGRGRAIFYKKWPEAGNHAKGFWNLLLGKQARFKFIIDYWPKQILIRAIAYFFFEYIYAISDNLGYVKMKRKLEIKK